MLNFPFRSSLQLSAFAALVLATGFAAAQDKPPPGGQDWRQRTEEFCKTDPQKCADMKKRFEAGRAACKEDPAACQKRREEMRKKREERCASEPQACKAEREERQRKREAHRKSDKPCAHESGAGHHPPPPAPGNPPPAS